MKLAAIGRRAGLLGKQACRERMGLAVAGQGMVGLL